MCGYGAQVRVGARKFCSFADMVALMFFFCRVCVHCLILQDFSRISVRNDEVVAKISPPQQCPPVQRVSSPVFFVLLSTVRYALIRFFHYTHCCSGFALRMLWTLLSCNVVFSGALGASDLRSSSAADPEADRWLSMVTSTIDETVILLRERLLFFPPHKRQHGKTCHF